VSLHCQLKQTVAAPRIAYALWAKGELRPAPLSRAKVQPYVVSRELLGQERPVSRTRCHAGSITVPVIRKQQASVPLLVTTRTQ
jgi:hypothetical protein